jgi:hypothetical protein
LSPQIYVFSICIRFCRVHPISQGAFDSADEKIKLRHISEIVHVIVV